MKDYKIEEETTVISDRAFEDCTSLTNLTIPDSVTSIGQYAFIESGYYYNGLNWDNNALYIGKYLIFASGSENCVIKDGTTLVYDNAFDASEFKSIAIPDSVTNIGYMAFDNCTNLTDVKYNGTEVQWSKIKIEDGNSYLTALKLSKQSVNVYVKGSYQIKVSVKNPKLNKTSVSIKIGKTFTLKITGKVGKAKFSSTNKKIAIVSKSGKITVNKKAKKGKTCYIKVKTNGLTLKCKVKVK